MYLSKTFFTLVVAAAVSSAAPLVAPNADLLTDRDTYPQAYGAHALKMAEDDFKKAKREPDSAYPQAYGAHLLKMAEDDFKKVKRGADTK